MKPWKDLCITDDYIFCRVMSDETLCSRMIELLLDIKVDHLKVIQSQRVLAPSYANRSIRLDVYVKDSDRIFDIEMQTTDRHNLEKRARYYQGVLDVDQMEHSTDYNELKESYIIFICTFDPFKEDLLEYQVEQTITGQPNYKYNDSSHKLFYNLTASELQKKTSALGNFLRYLGTGKPTDSYTEQIQDAVTVAKTNAEWRKEYMTVGMWIDEEKKKAIEEGLHEGLVQGIQQGREQGLQQGIQQGNTQGQACIIQKLLATNKMTAQQIADMLNISLPQVQALASLTLTNA